MIADKMEGEKVDTHPVVGTELAEMECWPKSKLSDNNDYLFSGPKLHLQR